MTRILFDCPPCISKEDGCFIDDLYDPLDSFEISFFDEVDAFYTCGHDAPLNEIVLVDYEQHALCDAYVVEFVHDATEKKLREENMVVGIFMLLQHLHFC